MKYFLHKDDHFVTVMKEPFGADAYPYIVIAKTAFDEVFSALEGYAAQKLAVAELEYRRDSLYNEVDKINRDLIDLKEVL